MNRYVLCSVVSEFLGMKLFNVLQMPVIAHLVGGGYSGVINVPLPNAARPTKQLSFFRLS